MTTAEPVAGPAPVAEEDPEVLAIMNDASLSVIEKARKKQALMNARWLANMPEDSDDEENATADADLEHLKCGICLELCDRPVTAPCQHNFCLKCFRRWTNQGKKQCPSCRADIPKAFSNNPRINTMLTVRIRQARRPGGSSKPGVTHAPVIDETRPDEAFMTANAKRKGLSNAASGRMRVTCPPHHFGPIGAEFDPERSQGIAVGECWQNRLHCRQWGAHLPHVAGIAGQSEVGAQSVVLSGGYEDDRDEGEWFLYTGSGGRDLSGNKRTNKEQSFDQKFEAYNKALLKSCERGLPVRVVRSFKEKRSAYAPTDAEWGVRYDGIYRIVACWRNSGNQGKLMCRFLFRRCDNEPAPWITGDDGDGPWDEELPEEASKEMNNCKEKVITAGNNPFWDYDRKKSEWGWTKDPPVAAVVAKKAPKSGKSLIEALQKQKKAAERSLNACHCTLCKLVLSEPLCTPCGHYFCKGCLVTRFDTEAGAAAPTSSARTFRARKQAKACPTCKHDLTDFMKNAQVNHAMNGQIENLRRQLSEAEANLKAELERQEREKPQYEELTSSDDAPAAEAAMGWVVEVLWSSEKAYFRGMVSAYNPAEGKHLVEFEDGDKEWYALADEDVKWFKEVPRDVADEEDDAAPAEEKAQDGGSAQADQKPFEECEEEIKRKQEVAAAMKRAAEARAAEEAAAQAEAMAKIDARKQEIYKQFGDMFDAALIDAMLADQDNDVEEVHVMLKRMKNQQKREASRLAATQPKANGEATLVKKKVAKRGRPAAESEQTTEPAPAQKRAKA